MDFKASKERIRKLNTGGLQIGDNVAFCYDCEFQIINGAVPHNRCPIHDISLHVIRVDKEFMELMSGAK